MNILVNPSPENFNEIGASLIKIQRDIHNEMKCLQGDDLSNSTIDSLQALMENILKQVDTDLPDHSLSVDWDERNSLIDTGSYRLIIGRTLDLSIYLTLSKEDIQQILGYVDRLSVSYETGDHMCFEKSRGSYYIDEDTVIVDAYCVYFAYLEMVDEVTKELVYVVHGMEYYSPEDFEAALNAFMSRITGDAPRYPTGGGMSLEDIYHASKEEEHVGEVRRTSAKFWPLG